MPNNLNIFRALIAEEDPELASYLEQKEGNDLLRALLDHQKAKDFGVDEIIRIIKEARRDHTLSPALLEEIIKQATPIKGEDYFTDKEVQEIVNRVQASIRMPKDGRNGESPTSHYLISLIKPLIPKVKNGSTPIKGADYFTELEQEAMISEVLSRIEIPESEEVDTGAIVKSVVKELKRGGKSQLEMQDIKNMPLNMNDMRWHGGGFTDSNFIDNEVVAGSGTTYTLAKTPNVGSQHVYAIGQRLTPTVDYTISGKIISTVLSWNAGDILADYRTTS